MIRAAAYQQARFLVQRNEEYRTRYLRLLQRSSHRLLEIEAQVAIMNTT
jgi:hypothetical protein